MICKTAFVPLLKQIHEEPMTTSKTKKIRPGVYGGWAGFTDGRLDVIEVDAGWGGYGNGDRVKVPAIFSTKKEARKKYEDVRRVSIQSPT